MEKTESKKALPQKERIPSIHVQGRAISFREGINYHTLGIQSYCETMIGGSNHLPFSEGDWTSRDIISNNRVCA